MNPLELVELIVGNRYGRVKSVCKGGSWLYTESGRAKICVPKFVPIKEGEKLPKDISYELLEEEVLFFETDRGIVVKERTDYVFYPEGYYKLEWKT